MDVTEAATERPATMLGLTSTTAFLRTFLRFKTKSRQIVSTLVGLCAEDSRKRAATKSPENLTTYEHVLRGRYYWPDCRGSVEDWNRAREEFQKALELDPSGSAAKVTHARGRYAHHVRSPSKAEEEVLYLQRLIVDD